MSVIEIGEIRELLPHRYPFLLIDRVLELELDQRVVGIKNVTVNEPFFQGHFPQQPIMPGVLILEAMAQIGGVLAIKSAPTENKPMVYLTGIDEGKFRKPVVPGDQIRFEVEVLRRRPPYWKMKGKALVDDQVVCEAEMTAMVMDGPTGEKPGSTGKKKS